MKKTLLPVVLMFSTAFVVTTALADNAQNTPNTQFLTTSTPTQAYHSVGDNASTAQLQPQAQSASPDNSNETAYLNSAGVDTSFQGELSRITQENITFEQQVNARIQNLNDSNQAVGGAIQNINMQLAQLQQQIKIMQTQEAGQAASAKGSSWKSLVNSLNQEDILVYINMGIAALFLMGFGLVAGRRFQGRSLSFASISAARKMNMRSDTAGDDTKSEYDFMGTKEAIPAQIDLARSYIAMGDHDQARSILKTVIDRGDKDHSIEAKLLMDRMQKK